MCAMQGKRNRKRDVYTKTLAKRNSRIEILIAYFINKP
jgi:hypothetical protein